ncbi:MAG: pyrroloquinoline quinone-dependent dehydrogenase [Spongiibacteraceae bacterium]|nr:pyrroloquinoline quinone-dependent dehydrogenase [Spongiibacteraceae bacterium]
MQNVQRMGNVGLFFLVLLLLNRGLLSSASALENSVGQHQDGTQYSPLSQITTDNVAKLSLAWEYHTGDIPPTGDAMSLTSFQDQPSLIDGKLVVCSITRRLIALDPATGQEQWTYDPKIPEVSTKKCRGIGHWVDIKAGPDTQCRSRIFLGTTDYKLHAIDAKTGKPCEGFGVNGVVDMPISKAELWPGEVAATSNPAVVNDVVVVGSAVADMQRADPPSGRILAFDARSGKPLWEFDPVPRDVNDPAMATWGKGSEGFGQGNVWSSMAVDQALDLVYLPTSSVSDDYFGGNRPGDNEYGTSVVALRGATGEVVWHRQLVHHNVWDYDIPARPMLIDYPHQGVMVPALLQNTKMGLVFIFDRANGEPLIPIEERPVPQEGAVPDEVLSPTQPFPVGMPSLLKHSFSPEDAWGFTFIDKWFCQKKIEAFNYGPIYTPISEKGTIVVPSVGGGPNWGGGAYDPASNIMVVPSNRVPTIVKLIPRAKAKKLDVESKVETKTVMTFENPGSPYVVEVEPLLSIFGAPCSEPPWAALSAIDIVKKKILWEVPLGSIKKLAPGSIDWHLGTPGAGGPLVTASGLVFIAYSLDDTLRAFDLHTGEILWEADLPAAGTAIPVSYEINGEQYIIIAAGGHSMYGSTMGDSVMAYKLSR